MCGILFHYSTSGESIDQSFTEFSEDELKCGVNRFTRGNSSVFNRLVPYTAERGPNYASFRHSSEHGISWFSSVLSIRQPLTKQSIDCGDKYVVQYNGELYNQDITDNDTHYLVKALNSGTHVIDVIRSLYGEFAYTIYDKMHQKLYFGRDSVGRRSLSYKLDPDNGELFVASVSGNVQGFQNCKAGIIYIFDTNSKSLLMNQQIDTLQYSVSSTIDNSTESLISNCDALNSVLREAVRQRVRSIQPVHNENNSICILFSGGLDCSVITALICQELQLFGRKVDIELLNVGFENPRTGLQPADVPDRKLAFSSALKLQELFPTQAIKLIEIDVSYEQFLLERPKIIDLIFPKRTEMDLSIAAAFYFASRGEGFVTKSDGLRVPYKRHGVVLFSGLGADELYGGYHKLDNKTIEELVKELASQISNIHDRNLNRDDKVIASNGVEVRYPFLDDNVIRLSTQLPINYKFKKMILRELARTKLALGEISEEPKRAIQFGAKSAKMTKNGNKHGTDLL